jgi:uncharacterized membrane protein YphA (DoxX/SURF4 family)
MIGKPINYTGFGFPGVLIFAVGIMALAVQQMFYAELRPVYISSWPAWLPGYAYWAYVGNLVIVAACAAVIFNKRGRKASLLLATIILLLFIVNHVPYQAANNPTNIGAWTSALKGLAVSGGFLITAGALPVVETEYTGTGMKFLYRLIPLGSIFFSIMMIVFGIDHLLYGEYVATLVPAWLPWHIFWTYFAGVALIAGGAGILFNIQARLAAALSGIMIFIWLAILHIPRAVADPYSGNGNEVRSVCEAFAFSGIAFVLAFAPQKKKGTGLRRKTTT